MRFKPTLPRLVGQAPGLKSIFDAIISWPIRRLTASGSLQDWYVDLVESGLTPIDAQKEMTSLVEDYEITPPLPNDWRLIPFGSRVCVLTPSGSLMPGEDFRVRLPEHGAERSSPPVPEPSKPKSLRGRPRDYDWLKLKQGEIEFRSKYIAEHHAEPSWEQIHAGLDAESLYTPADTDYLRQQLSKMRG